MYDILWDAGPRNSPSIPPKTIPEESEGLIPSGFKNRAWPSRQSAQSRLCLFAEPLWLRVQELLSKPLDRGRELFLARCHIMLRGDALRGLPKEVHDIPAIGRMFFELRGRGFAEMLKTPRHRRPVICQFEGQPIKCVADNVGFSEAALLVVSAGSKGVRFSSSNKKVLSVIEEISCSFREGITAYSQFLVRNPFAI